MTDADLADEVIARLNEIISNPAVRADVRTLMEQRIVAATATADHPTIQVIVSPDGTPTFGCLGLINGIIGTVKGGKKDGWGHVSAEYADDGSLIRFVRTES